VNNKKSKENSELYEINENTKKTTKWKLLAIWCLVVVIINFLLFTILILFQANIRIIGGPLGTIFTFVIFYPLFILLLTQIWGKYRNARSRIKAILYTSYVIVIVNLSPLLEVINNVAENIK
jgi:cation transport ATPase